MNPVQQSGSSQLLWPLPIKYKQSPLCTVTLGECSAAISDLVFLAPETLLPSSSSVLSSSWQLTQHHEHLGKSFLTQLTHNKMWSVKALLLAVTLGITWVIAAPAMDRPGMVKVKWFREKETVFREAERLCQAFTSWKYQNCLCTGEVTLKYPRGKKYIIRTARIQKLTNRLKCQKLFTFIFSLR